MNRLFYLTRISILVMLASAATAQRLPFKNYTTADGLPGSNIYDITQDKYGYIWINTDGGVARYDGVTFRNYTAEDSLSYVFRDSSGYVYLSGPGGIWRMAGDERKFYPIRRNLGSPVPPYVLAARDGTLWFWHYPFNDTTKYAGLSKIVNDHIEEYPDTLTKLSTKMYVSLNHFFEDYRGNLWMIFPDFKLGQLVVRKFSNGTFTEGFRTYGISEDWRVNDVIGDRYGNLWFFCEQHVGEEWRWATFKLAKGRLAEYSDNTEFALRKGLLDDEGHLWLLVTRYDQGNKIRRPAGVVKAVEDTLQWFTKEHGLASDEVQWIFPGKHGALWFIGGRGVSKYQNVKLQKLVGNFGWSDIGPSESNDVSNVFEDSKGRVWFAWRIWSSKKQSSKTLGITVYTNGHIKNYTSAHGIVGENWAGKRRFGYDLETVFLEDNYGNVWFQSDKALFSVANEELRKYDQENGLAGPLTGAFFQVFQDRERNIWIGTQSGLSKLADQSYERFTMEDGLSSNNVWSICQDAGARIWVRTGNQLHHISDKVEKFSLVSDDIFGHFTDTFGNVWFSVRDRVSKFDGKDVQSFVLTQEYATINPQLDQGFFQDDSGNIWFGAYNRKGVSKFDGKNVHHYTPKDGLVEGRIDKIFQDYRGHLWFVTYLDVGISEFDGTRFKNYTKENGELDPTGWPTCSVDQRKHVWLIQKGVLRDLTDASEPARQLPDMVRGGAMTSFWDREGNNWLGTYGGLVKIRRNDYQIFTTKDGLPGNRISGIAQDRSGNIWVGTEKGIGVYDGIRFHNYNPEHGLEPVQINGNPYVDRNGNIWFGSTAGLIKVNVARAFEKSVPPLVHVKAIQIDTLQVPIRNKIELEHDQNNLAFSYIGLSFENEQAIRYQYFLGGYDKKWSAPTDKREVRYTNLDDGMYLFKVKAINAAGAESETASIAFTIFPPFWQTWWFLTLSALSLLYAGHAAYRRRLNAKLEKARLLNELKTAHEVQMGLMPTSDPVVAGFDISGLCKPAEEVGGDYFDYVWLDEEKTKLGIAIVDVSGKAMKGALTAVMTSGMIYSEISNNQSPRTILQRMNRPMYLKTKRQIFTAMSFAVIDTRSKTLNFSNAGQAKPILKRNGDIQYIVVEGMHLPLGIQKDVEYGEVTIQLRSGDVVIFYTDGVPEAMNEKNELFDFERLETAVRTIPSSLRAAEIVERLLSEVGKFSGRARQHDDITLVVVKIVS